MEPKRRPSDAVAVAALREEVETLRQALTISKRNRRSGCRLAAGDPCFVPLHFSGKIARYLNIAGLGTSIGMLLVPGDDMKTSFGPLIVKAAIACKIGWESRTTNPALHYGTKWGSLLFAVAFFSCRLTRDGTCMIVS